MGRGGAKGGLRITKKEMVQILLKRIQEEIREINSILAEEREELKQKLPLIIGFGSLFIADLLDDGAINGSIFVNMVDVL